MKAGDTASAYELVYVNFREDPKKWKQEILPVLMSSWTWIVEKTTLSPVTVSRSMESCIKSPISTRYSFNLPTSTDLVNSSKRISRTFWKNSSFYGLLKKICSQCTMLKHRFLPQSLLLCFGLSKSLKLTATSLSRLRVSQVMLTTSTIPMKKNGNELWLSTSMVNERSLR